MAAGCPKRCTGIIARLRGEMTVSTVFGSRQKASSSMSAKTGMAPAISAHVAVEVKVYGGTMTSSPGCTPHPNTAAWSAAVAELKATAKRAPWNSANSASNWRIRRPPRKCSPGLAMNVLRRPSSRTSMIARRSASPITGYGGNAVVRIFRPPSSASSLTS